MEALEGELAEQLAREADARQQRRAAAGAQDSSGGGGRPGKKKAGAATQEEGEEEEEEGEEEDEEEKDEEEEEEEPGAGADQAIVARQAGLGGDAEGTRSSAGRHGAYFRILSPHAQCQRAWAGTLRGPARLPSGMELLSNPHPPMHNSLSAHVHLRYNCGTGEPLIAFDSRVDGQHTSKCLLFPFALEHPGHVAPAHFLR